MACDHQWRLAGDGTELAVEVDSLREAMRHVYSHRAEAFEKGRRASEHVRAEFTWDRTAALMRERIKTLAESDRARPHSPRIPLLSACIDVDVPETLADCLARLRPFAEEIIVAADGESESTAIAAEYGARTLPALADEVSNGNRALLQTRCRWILSARSSEFIEERSLSHLRDVLEGAGPDVNGYWLKVCSGDAQYQELRVFRNRNELHRTHPGGLDVWPAADVLPGVTRETELSVCNLAGDGHARLETAMERLQRVSQQSPTCPYTQLWLATCHHAAGNYFHAECYLTEYLSTPRRPRAAQAWRMLLDCYRRTDEPERMREAAVRSARDLGEDEARSLLDQAHMGAGVS